MHIAILSDDCLPTSTLVHAKMLHELALKFINLGHQVVIIAPANKKQRNKLEISNYQGVDYWKFKSGKLRGQGKIKRAINETLLSYKAWNGIKDDVLVKPFDSVVYYSPTIFFGGLVKKLKKICKCPSYLILRDQFPQWAIDEGLIKSGSLIEKYFRFFERVNYQAADNIGLMSKKNEEIFNELNPSITNTHILYNWAENNVIKPKNNLFDLRSTYNLANKIIFFYGGNIGHAQDMGNLLRLSKSMIDNKNAHFVFLGQGDEVELVKNAIIHENLYNTTFIPSVSQSTYKEILTQVDIGLFTLSVTHKTHNFPGKLLGYMVQSLPILGSVNPGNDLKEVVEDAGAGFIFTNGEDEKLLNAAKRLVVEKELRDSISNNSHKLLISKFEVEAAAKVILTKLKPNGNL